MCRSLGEFHQKLQVSRGLGGIRFPGDIQKQEGLELMKRMTVLKDTVFVSPNSLALELQFFLL